MILHRHRPAMHRRNTRPPSLVGRVLRTAPSWPYWREGTHSNTPPGGHQHHDDIEIGPIEACRRLDMVRLGLRALAIKTSINWFSETDEGKSQVFSSLSVIRAYPT